MTSALFVDDHPIVLRGCRIVLQDLGVHDIYEATTVDAGFDAYIRHRPDVVVLDLTFEGDDLDGLLFISRLMREDKSAKILVFSMHNDPAIVMRALETGAIGFVLKDTSSSELALAVEHVMRGENYLSHQLAMHVAMLRLTGHGPAETHDLTDREKLILEFLSRGHDYMKIAQALGVSYKTITNACSTMRSKLNIGSLAELIRFSIRHDLRRPS